MALRSNPRRRDMTEVNATLADVAELVDEALDPELSREELVAKVKEISELIPEEQGQ